MKKSKSLNNLEQLEYTGKNNINLVLDLDNTLINTYVFSCDTQQEQIENFKNKKDAKLLTSFEKEKYYYFVFERPYLNYFIMYISKYFNIYTYTNGLKFYHDIIIQELNKKYPMFKIIDSMYKLTHDDSNIKNLNKLNIVSKYSFNKLSYEYNTIIIDDREDVWPFDRTNLIQIPPYYNLEEFDEDILVFLTEILDLLNKEYNKMIKKNKKISIQVLLHKLKSYYNI